MSRWSRLANIFRGNRPSREIEEELAAHLREAIEHGRDPSEARRALGSTLRHRESSREIKIAVWLDSLRADAVFGWRQLKKRKVTSAAAVLSLALAIGACTSAFRLVDALFLRPLPITGSERLYVLTRKGIGPGGAPQVFDGWEYPAFLQMQAAVRERAELIAVSHAERWPLTYDSDEAMEKAYVQYVSGGMFQAFRLRPALGRLLTRSDDVPAGAHPYAVLSYDYWAHRFARNPKVIGRTFRAGTHLYEIIGVGPESFTGTEPGTIVDVFIPITMSEDSTNLDNTWHRTLALLRDVRSVGPVRDRLSAVSLSFERDRAKRFTGWPKQRLEDFLNQKLMLERAPSGVSDLQNGNRRSLLVLSVLVLLMLLVVCVNVANLMLAQGSARAREMAIRVSIGAGSIRLARMVLIESIMLACFATLFGALFAWWSAPLVVGGINPPDNPARLVLPADWRVLGFGLALTLVVTLMFGLAPALRASSIRPVSALKGGEDLRSGRSMRVLIAAQTAFCFLVLFVACLFVSTLEHLSHRATGFSADRILTLGVGTQQDQPAATWSQALEHMKSSPGVESVALAGWPLLDGYGWNSFVSINGGRPSEVLAYILNVSPGWFATMKIPLLSGRDFRTEDVDPGAAIVNETFVRQYFDGRNPIGRWFDRGRLRCRIIGIAGDAAYSDIREPVVPVAYVPFHSADSKGTPAPTGHGTFLIRTASANPLALVSSVREDLRRTAPALRVYEVRTQAGIDDAQTIRERLLAALAVFFAVVAVLLAGVGLYGVLDYSVLQRRREIGIRIAIGTRAGDVAWRVTANVFAMVLAGAAAGLALGMGSVRYIQGLLYQVKATDLTMLAVPGLTLLAVALLAAVSPVIRAVRIDPVRTLRAE